MQPPLSEAQLERALHSPVEAWCDSTDGTLFDLWCQHVGIEPNTYESAITFAAFSAAREYFLALKRDVEASDRSW